MLTLRLTAYEESQSGFLTITAAAGELDELTALAGELGQRSTITVEGDIRYQSDPPPMIDG